MGYGKNDRTIGIQYAYNVSEMINAFDPRELEGDELDLFYYDGTMFARTGRRNDKPIVALMNACRRPCRNSAYLFVGHRGCGKSTELNKMAELLEKEGYKVRTIQCSNELNMRNPLCADILMLMGTTLLGIADEINCNIDKKILEKIREFWSDREEEIKKESGHSIDGEAHISGDVPSLLQFVLKLGTSISTSIKYGETRLETSRKKIVQKAGEWTDSVNRVADAITEKLDGKQPVIIFEDLDKLQGEKANQVFFEDMQTQNLTKFDFPVIYTFPIALRYSTQYKGLDGYFREKFFFPMIKLETIDGEVYKEGYSTIRSIVDKRANLDLFEGAEYFDDVEKCDQSVLNLLISKTGGSLRDLFIAIREAAELAEQDERKKISIDDATAALQKLRRDLKTMIERDDYAFLANICKGNREDIENKEKLLEMMQGGIVMEYNGDGWHNVHPLVQDFLKKLGWL